MGAIKLKYEGELRVLVNNETFAWYRGISLHLALI
jgi:hypothetical protein